ncbi:MAG: ECF transporter S component [Clostridia bacterium]|nr:ECF transporter S component [Clostridia bacterium]
MSTKVSNKSKSTAILGMLIAITVVLQILSYVIPPIGGFSLSLVLIPIVLSAVLYGPAYASTVGFAFGVVAAIASVFGMDAGGHILFQSSPFLTILVCLLKGTAAGFFSALVAKVFKNQYLSVIFAAITAPITNTGIFIAFTTLFMKEGLANLAGGTNLIYALITGVILINFVIEMAIDIFLSPVVLRVVKAVKK